jgi:hypothetical protein
MAIRVRVKKSEQQRVKGLGGMLLPGGKDWVIPDGMGDINGFRPWLPQEEGHIVLSPYFVLRAKWPCWKCGKETPVVALGAKNYQYAFYQAEDEPFWEHVVNAPLIFTQVEHLDPEIRQSMVSNYPFFKKPTKRDWGNCCVHCGAFMEEDDDYSIGFRNPFSPMTEEAAKEIRVIYFRLNFDYYIVGGYQHDTLIPIIID